MKNKLITIITMALILIICTTVTVNAAQSVDDIISSADSFIQTGNDQSDTIDQGKLKEGIQLMFSVLMSIGVFLATAIGIIVGIKLMTASTADEKAKYKKILITYIVGCVVIFGAAAIWRTVVTVLNNNTPDGGGGGGGTAQATPTASTTKTPENKKITKGSGDYTYNPPSSGGDYRGSTAGKNHDFTVNSEQERQQNAKKQEEARNQRDKTVTQSGTNAGNKRGGTYQN